MSTSMDAILKLDGLTWSAAGYAGLSGDLLSLYRRVDAMFIDWSQRWNADEYQFPDFISAAALAKISYLESFGHLATIPCAYDPTTRQTLPLSDQLLTPAACYHFYCALQATALERPKFLTTRAHCFRREKEYIPLQRQWCFGMREIVCIGTADDVSQYLQAFRRHLEEFFANLNLPVQFEHATDPFFNPASNPKYLMQKIDQVKTEMVFNGELAIGSLNNHRTTFGEAFNITINNEPAHSACVAFGLERWIFALISHFGLQGPYPISGGSSNA